MLSAVTQLLGGTLRSFVTPRQKDFSIMIKFIKNAALGLPLCAIAALAQPALAAEGSAAVKGAAVSAEKAEAKASQPKKYCMRLTQDTGTRIAKRECRTRAEWEQLDIEVAAEK
jgi:uncharacterized protein (DUF2384 family)